MNKFRNSSVRFLILAVPFFFFSGCGGKDGTNPSDGANPGGGSDKNILFFKATGGEHYYITPFVGLRLYDNNAYVYVFKRDCEDPKDSAVKKVSISWSGKSVAESPRMGGIGETTGACSFDANFIYENNTLKVTGKANGKDNGLDILMTRTTRDDFFQGVKAVTSGKGFNYLQIPRDDRNDFDEACKQLAGVASCESLLN